MNATPHHRKELEAIVLVMALVLYGSLFPFTLVPHEVGWSDWQTLFHPTGASPVSDIVGNVLLFVPYGALLTRAYFRSARMRWVLLGAVFAFGIQYLQFWFESRDPSGLDALLNVTGILLGMLGGNAAARRLHQLTHAQLARPQFLHVATGLMVLWVAYRWFPLVPMADWKNIKNGLKPLLDWSHLNALDVWRNFAGWLVFCGLFRFSVLQRLEARQLALLALGVLLAQPLFTNNAIQPAHVVGLLAALLLLPSLKTGAGSMKFLALVLGSSIVLSALSPFTVGAHQPFNWLPFSGWLTGDMWQNLASLVEKMYLLGSLLFLLRNLGLSRSGVMWSVGLSLFALEWAQQWLPGRTPEITDALLVLVLSRVLNRVLPGAPPTRAGPPATH